MVYIDTPGLHQNYKGAIHRYMNREALTTLQDVDVIVFVMDGLRLTPEDEYAITLLEKCDQPVILVVNKTDKIKTRNCYCRFWKISVRAQICPGSAGFSCQGQQCTGTGKSHRSPSAYFSPLLS